MILTENSTRQNTAFGQLTMMRELRRFEIDAHTREVTKRSIASYMTARQISIWDSLALAADYKTGIAQRSIKSISRSEGLSRSQTIEVLNNLEAMGGLIRIRGGRGKPTHYMVTLPRSPDDRTSQNDQLVRSVALPLVRSTEPTSPADRTRFVPNTPNTKSSKGTEAPANFFPQSLDTPAFAAAWSEYLAYRREYKFTTLQPRSVKTQLDACAEWGHDDAIESIRLTIANGWRGLFQPKKKGNRNDRRQLYHSDHGQFAEPTPQIRTRVTGDIG